MEKEKNKIYIDEEKEDIKFPELIDYEEILYTPEKLEDVNKDEADIAITGGSRALTGLDADGNLIKEVLNTKLNTSAQQILAEYTFGVSGAIKITGSGAAGVWISPSGILGKDVGGNTTFSLAASSGSAYFKGEIMAGSVIGGEITGGTITGARIRTAGSGMRIQLETTGPQANYILAYSVAGLEGGIAPWYNSTTDRGLLIEATDASYGSIKFQASGALKMEIDEQGVFVQDDIFPWYNNAYDLGASNLKWRNLYLANAIFAGGAVIYFDGHFVPNIGSTYNLGSSVYPWGSTYVGLLVSNTHTPGISNAYDLGASNLKWRNLWLSGDIQSFDDITPQISNTSFIGWATNYLYAIYSNYVYYKNLVAFQHHDDIALIKNIKSKIIKTEEIISKKLNKEGVRMMNKEEQKKEVWDENTMPKNVYRDGFYDAGSLNGLIIGTLKQLIERVEKVEQKIN